MKLDDTLFSKNHSNKRWNSSGKKKKRVFVKIFIDESVSREKLPLNYQIESLNQEHQRLT